MRLPKFVIFLLICVLLGGGGYIFYLKNQSAVQTTSTTSAVEVTRGDMIRAIEQTGKAELANEQKLRFAQNGKVTEIFVKVGDIVKKNQVLAVIDKREFFQELAQAQNRIEKTERDIAEERKKNNSIEIRRMERDIAGMERKLLESKEELSKFIQNSPGKSQEKLLDLNAKKRELQIQKDKYDLDKKSYENEFSNQEQLIASKIEESQKGIKNIIQGANTSLAEMRSLYREINKMFGFDQSQLTSSDRTKAMYVSADAPGLRANTENLWRELRTEIEMYNDISFRVSRESLKTDDAQGLINSEMRVYKKLLDLIDMARRAVDATRASDSSGLSSSEITALQSEISGFRNSIQSRIASLTELKNTFILFDTPEKVSEKFLAELKTKKLALETLEDAIKRSEIQIGQEEGNIQVAGSGFVVDESSKKEVAERQSAIADQEDAIATKREELQKLRSGKNEALENLETTLKDQRAEIEKLRTKEEQYEIRAPFDGMIRSISLKVGDVLGGADAREENKTILLENSDIINIKVGLNQLDIIKVKIGQEASISFEAVPEAVLIGKITEISSTPSSSPDGGGDMASYGIIISAEKGNYPIYSGMDARISIQLDSRSGVLLLPTTAVSEDSQGEKYVNIIEGNGGIRKVIVQTGETNNGNIEIISGLSEGQKVQVIDFSANNFSHSDFTPPY